MGITANGRSAELSFNGCTCVGKDEQIRPLWDQIVVEPLEVNHSTLIVVIEHTKPLRGIVKAVGPGHYPKRYDHPDKHRRTKFWYSKTFLPTQVKVGDVVNLGSPQDARGYNFQTFIWGQKPHLICREADICGVEDAA